jgi:hypothetical protein
MIGDKRRLARKNLSYYMRVIDESTGKMIGHLADLSTMGFKVESKQTLPSNRDMRLRLEQTNEISTKSYITFTARSRWCKQDHLDPTSYNIGFQILEMTPTDYDIFIRMYNTYGTQQNSSQGTVWR